MIATEPKCNCLSQELWGDEAHLVSCPRSKLYSSPSPTVPSNFSDFPDEKCPECGNTPATGACYFCKTD